MRSSFGVYKIARPTYEWDCGTEPCVYVLRSLQRSCVASSHTTLMSLAWFTASATAAAAVDTILVQHFGFGWNSVGVRVCIYNIFHWGASATPLAAGRDIYGPFHVSKRMYGHCLA